MRTINGHNIEKENPTDSGGVNLEHANIMIANGYKVKSRQFYKPLGKNGRVDLRGVNLECANLELANLGGLDLRNSNLNGANLKKSYLYMANLSEASLKGAKLSGAMLGMANLTGANLQGADLQLARVGGANFTDTNLNNLVNSRLRPCDDIFKHNVLVHIYDGKFYCSIGFNNYNKPVSLWLKNDAVMDHYLYCRRVSKESFSVVQEFIKKSVETL